MLLNFIDQSLPWQTVKISICSTFALVYTPGSLSKFTRFSPPFLNTGTFFSKTTRRGQNAYHKFMWINDNFWLKCTTDILSGNPKNTDLNIASDIFNYISSFAQIIIIVSRQCNTNTTISCWKGGTHLLINNDISHKFVQWFIPKS